MPTAPEKDQQSVTPDTYQLIRTDQIDGVIIKEMKHILTDNSLTTEVIRTDWGLGSGALEQVLHVRLRVGAISGWHLHQSQTDHVFCIAGSLKWVLFDDREGSATRGTVMQILLSEHRPQLILIPTGIWHAVQNTWHQESTFVNIFNRVYVHGDPDEWRLPLDSERIPYRF